MTTSNKLIAAICLAFIGGLVAEFVKPQMPEGSDPGHMTLISAVVGILVGWRIMGRRAGRVGSLELGILGVFWLVFWGLALFGLIEMLRLALRRHFDEPVEAMEAVVTIALDYGLYLSATPILITLVIGAIVSGYLTNFAHRRWG
ncbi:TrgA family protein [Shimia sp. MMG029]|uniref:TrgA family protein n=1 Tax=Shimia sp. MMG029 TaxID=3021978 RepID=UPI0022FE5A73|nr:TrgA family protein [Shimia sp. MMG029]MDA5555853.1 TrgA family protein [Shimia sp. MMG029]